MQHTAGVGTPPRVRYAIGPVGSRSYIVQGALPASVCPSLDELRALPFGRGQLTWPWLRAPALTSRDELVCLIDYYFSYTHHPAQPFPEIFRRLLEWANAPEQRAAFGQPEGTPHALFNGAVINRYRDGADHIPAHADDEAQLVAGAPIFSASFGAERVFRLRHKRVCGRDGKPLAQDIALRPNTYLVMGGDFQHDFTHEVPPVPDPSITGDARVPASVGMRMNVTFRVFKPKDPASVGV